MLKDELNKYIKLNNNNNEDENIENRWQNIKNNIQSTVEIY